VDEPSTSEARGGIADALRCYVDAVVGVTEVSRERAEKIVADLARRGEVRTKDIQKAARELADRSARNQRELARLIQKEIKRQIDALGLATRDDVGKLERRVDDLEDGAESAPEPAKKKPSARKKPATSRTPRPPARRSTGSE
jgi:polyhydroxyalkanoate synthesis regulator phasin